MPIKTQNSSMLGKGFSTIDMMGREFSFQFETLTKKFKTPIGGSASIILLLVSVATFFVIFSQLFESDAPVVTSSIEFGSQKAQHELYDQKIFNTFSLSNQGRLIPVADLGRYITIKAKVLVFAQNKETGIMETRNKHVYDVIPCTQIKDPHYLNPVKIMLPGDTLGIAVCIDFSSDPNLEHFSIKLDPEESYFQEAMIHVFPCSLPDKTQCASPQEISTTQLTVTRLDNYVVSTDKENPLRTIGDRYTSMLDLYNTKFKFLTVKQHRVIDDASLFSKPSLKLEFASPELTSSDTSSRNPMIRSCDSADVDSLNLGKCQEYIQFSYSAVPQLMIMRRTYKKLTGVMGEFGGVFKIFSSFIFFFYSIYSSFAIKKFLKKRLMEPTRSGAQLGGQGVQEYLKSLEKQKEDKNGQESKKLVKEMDEALTDMVKSRLNAVKILRQLNILEALQECLFSEEESELLPLALLNLRRKRLKAKKKQSKTKILQSEKISSKRMTASHRGMNFTYLEDNHMKAGMKNNKKKMLRQVEVEIDDDLNQSKKKDLGSQTHFQELYQRLKSRRNQNLEEEVEGDCTNQNFGRSSTLSNPIQEFIFTNVEELFSDSDEDSEPSTAQKVIKMKNCLPEKNSEGDPKHSEEVLSQEDSVQLEDLEIGAPRSKLLEYSSMSPRRSPALMAKRRKKIAVHKKISSSSVLGKSLKQSKNRKSGSDLDLEKNGSKFFMKMSRVESRKKNRSKGSLKLNLE